MERLPKRKGNCPFCKSETEFIVLQEAEYEGNVDDSLISKKKALEEKEPKSRYRIVLPRWYTRVLLCPLCGKCNVQEDKSKKGSVDYLLEDTSSYPW